MKVEKDGTHQAFEVRLSVHELDPEAVCVELYANPVNGERPIRQAMTRVGRTEGANGPWVYRARMPATRPAADYTVRVVPHHDGVAVPLETNRVMWQR
jgi:glycogen phosphorylase